MCLKTWVSYLAQRCGKATQSGVECKIDELFLGGNFPLNIFLIFRMITDALVTESADTEAPLYREIMNAHTCSQCQSSSTRGQLIAPPISKSWLRLGCISGDTNPEQYSSDLEVQWLGGNVLIFDNLDKSVCCVQTVITWRGHSNRRQTWHCSSSLTPMNNRYKTLVWGSKNKSLRDLMMANRHYAWQS